MCNNYQILQWMGIVIDQDKQEHTGVVQCLPQLSLCYRQSTGAAGRRLHWPALRGSGAAACESPPLALGHATQIP